MLSNLLYCHEVILSGARMCGTISKADVGAPGLLQHFSSRITVFIVRDQKIIGRRDLFQQENLAICLAHRPVE